MKGKSLRSSYGSSTFIRIEHEVRYCNSFNHIQALYQLLVQAQSFNLFYLQLFAHCNSGSSNEILSIRIGCNSIRLVRLDSGFLTMIWDSIILSHLGFYTKKAIQYHSKCKLI